MTEASPCPTRPLTMIEAVIPIVALILPPGRMFKGAFQKRGFALVVLSRSLGDSATVAYAPFTFFNFLGPLISVALAFLGVRMLKATSPESSPKS